MNKHNPFKNLENNFQKISGRITWRYDGFEAVHSNLEIIIESTNIFILQFKLYKESLKTQ